MGWLKTPGQQWWWQGGWNWEAGKMLELLEGCNTSEIYSLVSWVEVTDTKAKQYVSLHKLKRMVAVANCSLCNFQVYFFKMCTTVGGGVILVDSTGLPYCWEMCFAWAQWAMVQGLSVQVTTLDEVRTLIFGEAWHGMMLRMTMNDDYIDWGCYLWSIVRNRWFLLAKHLRFWLAWDMTECAVCLVTTLFIILCLWENWMSGMFYGLCHFGGFIVESQEFTL